MADSVEKVGFSVRLNSGMTTIIEPTHHIEWFLCPSLTFAARLLVWFEGFCIVQTPPSRTHQPDEPQPQGIALLNPSYELLRCGASRAQWLVGGHWSSEGCSPTRSVGTINLNQTVLTRWRCAGTYAAAG